MIQDIGNTNPTLWGLQGLYLPPGEPSPPDGRGNVPGNVWDWIQNNGDDAFDILNDALCTINPTRPGCAGDPVRNPPPVVVNQTPGWLPVALIGLFLLLFFIVLKR